MNSDPKDIVIEQLRQELETVQSALNKQRKANQQLQQESASQRRQLEQQAIDLKALANGTVNIYRDEIARLIKERDTYRDQFLELMHNLPIDVIDASRRDIPEGYTLIGLTLFGRDSSDPNPDALHGDVMLWSGNRREAIPEVFKLMYAGLYPTPLPTDVGRQAMDGLTEDDMQSILEILTHYRDNQPQNYDTERRNLFNQYWPQIEQSGYYQNRTHAQTRYNQFIERTFENRDRRRNQVNVTIIDGETKQNLFSDKAADT